MKRRQFIEKASLSAAIALAPSLALAEKAIGAGSSSSRTDNTNTLPDPKYTLAVHMNANFVRQAKSMPVEERFARYGERDTYD